MSNDFRLKTEALEGGFHGQTSSGSDKKRLREKLLRALLNAIGSGHVDAARVAFTSLISHAHELSHNTALSRMGAALQSSNIALAHHIAKEMLADPHQIFTGLAIALRPSSVIKENPAHRFLGGLTARLYDLSA